MKHERGREAAAAAVRSATRSAAMSNSPISRKAGGIRRARTEHGDLLAEGIRGILAFGVDAEQQEDITLTHLLLRQSADQCVRRG